MSYHSSFLSRRVAGLVSYRSSLFRDMYLASWPRFLPVICVAGHLRALRWFLLQVPEAGAMAADFVVHARITFESRDSTGFLLACGEFYSLSLIHI